MIALKNYKNSRYSVKKPSFWGGVASLFDLHNTRPTKIELSIDEDVKAMKSDFDLVGNDMWIAIKKYEQENKNFLKSKDKKTAII